MTKSNSLKSLSSIGQSVWLDYIDRSLIRNGKLTQLVRDGLRGLTSNPSIFLEAIGTSDDYDDSIKEIVASNSTIDNETLFEMLAVKDIQMAADILRDVYDDTNGTDGFVSFEVSPHLAHNTSKTISEAKRLWETIDRPNLMIKVPATKEGTPAIENLIGMGINVNITLMFSVAHYESVANAYINGLTLLSDPKPISSVASFFVSRVDTAVDAILEKIGSPKALSLRGKSAIMNCKLAYARFLEIFNGANFNAQKQLGFQIQRPLWGSTSTKNPEYSDVLYVEELSLPDTVNTLPPATLSAFQDHGHVQRSSVGKLSDIEQHFTQLREVGVDFAEITKQLQVNGIKAFSDSFNDLISTLSQKRQVIT